MIPFFINEEIAKQTQLEVGWYEAEIDYQTKTIDLKRKMAVGSAVNVGTRRARGRFPNPYKLCLLSIRVGRSRPDG
jgi:hypothetical protein